MPSSIYSKTSWTIEVTTEFIRRDFCLPSPFKIPKVDPDIYMKGALTAASLIYTPRSYLSKNNFPREDPIHKHIIMVEIPSKKEILITSWILFSKAL